MTLDEAALQTLLDESAIFKCLVRYARGIDRHDAALAESAYHADGVDHHGGESRSPEELTEWGNELHAIHTRSHQHLIGNPTIEIDGDTAHSEVYVLFALWRRDEPVVDISGGRYLDRLERREGAWGIVERLVVVDWAAHAPQGEGADGALAKYAGGTWGPEDPSYRRPLRWTPEDDANPVAAFGRLLTRND